MGPNGNHEEHSSVRRSAVLTLLPPVWRDETQSVTALETTGFLKHQQTFSIGASSSFSNKTTSMLHKGYDLTAMAAVGGKVVAAFTKDPSADELTIVEMQNDDPGISHTYRLGQSTLHHIAHDGNRWLFAYRQGKQLGSQKIVRCASANEVLIEIKKHWPHKYWVTSIAYGNGCWIIVFSKTTAVEQQSFFLARDNDTLQARTRKAWKDGKKISAIAYGEEHWLLVMSKCSTCEGQKWFSNKSFSDLKNEFEKSGRTVFALLP
jgi:hypothetical protein